MKEQEQARIRRDLTKRRRRGQARKRKARRSILIQRRNMWRRRRNNRRIKSRINIIKKKPISNASNYIVTI